MMQSWGPKSFGHRKRTRPPTATTYKAIKVPNCWVSPPSRRRRTGLPGSPRWVRQRRAERVWEALAEGLNAHDFEALPGRLISPAQNRSRDQQHSSRKARAPATLATPRALACQQVLSSRQDRKMPRICSGDDFVLIRLHAGGAAPISISVTIPERLGRSMVAAPASRQRIDIRKKLK